MNFTVKLAVQFSSRTVRSTVPETVNSNPSTVSVVVLAESDPTLIVSSEMQASAGSLEAISIVTPVNASSSVRSSSRIVTVSLVSANPSSSPLSLRIGRTTARPEFPPAARAMTESQASPNSSSSSPSPFEQGPSRVMSSPVLHIPSGPAAMSLFSCPGLNVMGQMSPRSPIQSPSRSPSSEPMMQKSQASPAELPLESAWKPPSGLPSPSRSVQ